jgi:hypothetical protein
MRLPQDFWRQISVTLIPTLEVLRQVILERRPVIEPIDGKKPRSPAMPKWHFRLPSTDILHLQPKINGFEGTAEVLFGADVWYLTFRIIITHDVGWSFKPWAIRSPYENCLSMETEEYAAIANVVRERVMNEIGNGFHRLNVSMMLSPSCLLFGRGLTDPVSQARWIGPECFGSASAIMPYIVSLTEGSPDLYFD